MNASDVHAVLVCVLEESGLPVERIGDRRITSLLVGEHKRTIPVLFDVGDRLLRVQSLFTGVPDEAHARVYALLLHRNERARHVHFALDDEGDVLLVGRLPNAAVDSELLGELLGELLTTADEAFDTVLRIGFAGYLEHEQAWRRSRGMAPNPVGAPDRGQEAESG